MMASKDFECVKEARAIVKEQMTFYNTMMTEVCPMKTVTGNLIDLAENGEFNVIVQGCNCFKTMGSGLAKELRARYPGVYLADLAYGESGDFNKLGTYSVYKTNRFHVINAYTQFLFNRGGTRSDLFEYTSFKLILEKLAHAYPRGKFGFPRIGCDLAGGYEPIIVGLIEDFSRGIESSGGSVTLVKFG